MGLLCFVLTVVAPCLPYCEQASEPVQSLYQLLHQSDVRAMPATNPDATGV